MTSLRYLHLDVFTSRPFAGNQLAVFPDARGLDDAAMQRIAREINFSETTFVLPAEQPGIDARMRIFTPRRELPMAGHRRIDTATGSRILAYGRDPYFAGWSDTLQLNFGNPALQDALLGELQRIAHQCDGIRCDMAMLVLPEIFERTWGINAQPFWPRATAAIRTELPGFIFLAEVSWDLEWTLQKQGFDYTYDKRLYDRLLHGQARSVREHLLAELDYQDHLARFLENHDEPRASVTFEP